LAIQLGAGFVARSFSGDKNQLIPLIKAAIAYKGFAFLDVISPCVTFNNHDASTKSYSYVREHNQVVENDLDFVEHKEEITVDYPAGTSTTIDMHDGSRLILHKLDGGHDATDTDAAIMAIRKSAKTGAVATGLLYVNPAQEELHDVLGTEMQALNAAPMSDLCPGSKALEAINARFR
jgi:2-oxoglutarate/2-oxoacid ferredoxin oxidoreductase subunit beta